MSTFGINVRQWFRSAFAVPVVTLPSKIERKQTNMNIARMLTGLAGGGHRRHHDRGSHDLHRSRSIYLQFVHRCASRVSIAASFNGWRPSATPMTSMGRGWWAKGLVLPPGRYEYCFVVDGQPTPDPNAAETVQTRDGHLNSVLVVPAETDK